MAQNKKNEYYKQKNKQKSTNSQKKNANTKAQITSKEKTSEPKPLEVQKIVKETQSETLQNNATEENKLAATEIFSETTSGTEEAEKYFPLTSFDEEIQETQQEIKSEKQKNPQNIYNGALAFVNYEQEIKKSAPVQNEQTKPKEIVQNDAMKTQETIQNKIKTNESKTKEEKKAEEKLAKEKEKNRDNELKKQKKEAKKNKNSIFKEKSVKIFIGFIVLVAIAVLVLFLVNSINQKKLSENYFEFDNTAKSSQTLTKEELAVYNLEKDENANISYKDVDFKVSVDIPTNAEGFMTVNNIPALSTKPYYYELAVTQTIGQDNIVMFKFYVYDQEEYDVLPDEMKQRHVMVKKFETQNKCLAYEQFPHNLSGNKDAFDDYMKFYREIDFFIQSFQLKK